MDNGDRHIELTIEGPIGYIAIHREEKLNALSWEMMTTLRGCAEELERSREVRAVIIHSRAARAFGVGADINDWGALPPLAMWRTWTRHGQRIFTAIEELIQPVLAVVNGLAFGGSLELALAADIRIGEAGSRYGFPEALVGTIPGWLGTGKALRLIGPSRLKKMIFTGRPVTDREALAMGLIDELVPAGEGLARARELAAEISAASPLAVSLGKQIVNSLASAPTAAPLEALASGLAAQSADGREGAQSFREKRPPSFTGF